MKWLWHGTANLLCSSAECRRSECSLCSIASTGFQPAKARRFGVSFETHGQATYFGNRSFLPHNYNGQNETALGTGVRAAILARVALGNCEHASSVRCSGLVIDFELYTCPYAESTFQRCAFSGAHLGQRPDDAFPSHFMVTQAQQCDPQYAVLYRYPLAWRKQVPWARVEEPSNGSGTQPSFCSFHRMIHGDFLGCDGWESKLGCV
jgi:hypothetical protein